MPDNDLFVTNLLLGVMAGVQLIVLIGILIGAWYARSTIKQVQGTVRDLEREHVTPLRAQAESILADVSRISARVEAQAARVDAQVTESLNVAERQVRRVKSAVDAVTRETTAVASGVRAMVSTLAGRTQTTQHQDTTTTTGRLPVLVSEEDRRHAASR